MLVRRPPSTVVTAALRAAALAVTALSGAVACNAEAKKDDHAGLVLDAAAFARPREAPLSGELVAKARAVKDAAHAIAATCSMEYAGITTTEIAYDACLYKQADVTALHSASTALASSGLVPETGPTSSFAAEARMFDDFVTDAMGKRNGEDYGYDYRRRERSRGTLAHYQDLATAWNSMVPQDPTPVDVARLIMDAGVSGPLRWERCGDLLCVKNQHP